ncbi:hypothetical protein [Pseudomonas sp. KU43P]|uniref:hypothetical protein n=1 Tax=Pseudomonas sp. KU43P TaxID=2487887 RepID=UPI002955B585|nr:hypothetical protein [Pseudomonas sp. KU43P]
MGKGLFSTMEPLTGASHASATAPLENWSVAHVRAAAGGVRMDALFSLENNNKTNDFALSGTHYGIRTP